MSTLLRSLGEERRFCLTATDFIRIVQDQVEDIGAAQSKTRGCVYFVKPEYAQKFLVDMKCSKSRIRFTITRSNRSTKNRRKQEMKGVGR